jgi:hypothetical protein
MSDNGIRARDLTREFKGGIRAVDGLDRPHAHDAAAADGG